MGMTWMEVLGLIGVTLVISTGKVFDGLRGFLKSFVHPWNPARWAGDIISCSMCSGVWVGGIWAIASGESVWVALVFGGVISLLSFGANEMLGLIGITTMRISRGMTSRGASNMRAVASLADARTRGNKRVVRLGEDITEEEADALVDAENERADGAA